MISSGSVPIRIYLRAGVTDVEYAVASECLSDEFGLDDDVTTLTRSNNLVENSLFRFCSRLRLTYAPSIRCRDTVGATIRHCEETDQPHIAVVIDGNDLLFEYNVISNVGYAADDASGYYAGRRPACQGNACAP